MSAKNIQEWVLHRVLKTLEEKTPQQERIESFYWDRHCYICERLLCEEIHMMWTVHQFTCAICEHRCCCGVYQLTESFLSETGAPYGVYDKFCIKCLRRHFPETLKDVPAS